jgi:hypothetical protein
MVGGSAAAISTTTARGEVRARQPWLERLYERNGRVHVREQVLTEDGEQKRSWVRSRSSARRTREGRAENFLVLTYSSRSPGSLSSTATHHLQPCARLQTALALLRCATAHVPRSAPSLLISHPCSRLPKPQLPPSSAVAIRTLDNLLLILRSRLLSGQAPCRLVPPELAAMRFNRPMLLDHPSVNKRNALLLRPRRVSLPMRGGV